jgi:pimeloyl-ACP methyl ester carboxylesterase
MRHTVSPLLGLLLAPLLFKQMFSPLPVSPRFRAGLPVGMTLRPSQIRAVAEDSAFMVPAAAALRRHYDELARTPVAILAGQGDKVVSADAQPVWLRRALPHSGLDLAPGVGHMVHYARPEDVVAAVNAVAAGGEEEPRPILADAA